MYFILYFIREAVTYAFLDSAQLFTIDRKNGKSNLFIKYYFPYTYY